MENKRAWGRVHRALVGAVALAIALVAPARHVDAHKAVTSKYNFNKDVFPLLRDHCGACHVAGGPAPMSLLTYKDAVAWAEDVRDELTAERMPPWPLGPQGPAVKGAHLINAHDLDVIVTWASGGTPLGPDAVIPDAKFSAQWKLGAPDLAVQMDAPATLGPGVLTDTRDLSLPTGLTEARWVKAADLLPGTPTLVRDAIISVENGPVLALWQPGNDPVAPPSGAAFKLLPGATLHLQIHYKKHFDVEQDSVSDRSTVGLYFAAAGDASASRELQSLTLTGPATDQSGAVAAIVSGAPGLSGPARIVAVRPLLDKGYAAVDVEALLPNGSHQQLLALNAPRPQWFRRYWLERPVELPAGTSFSAKYIPLPPTADDPKIQPRFPLQVAIDYVMQ